MALGAILLGAPAGALAQSFSQAPVFSTGDLPLSVAAGDFNRDGKTDLAVANGLSDDVSVLLGDGTGGFAPAVNHPALGASAIVTQDFNRDGRLDLAVARSFGVSIWLGDGVGGFPTQTEFSILGYSEFVTTADFNHDGSGDLAIALWDPVATDYAVAILLGDGLGGFSTSVNHATGDGASSIAVADLNGDGNLDFAVANLHSNTVSVHLGDGAGGFGAYWTVTVGFSPSSVTAADFNADGRVDLAVANVTSASYGPSTITVHLGNGSGGFSPPVEYVAGNVPWAIGAADFNGDAKVDLAVANRGANTVSVLVGDGAGGFLRTTADYGVGRQPVSIVIAHLNGDGAADIAVANQGDSIDTAADVSILLGDGSGSFPAAALSYRVGSHALALAIGEFNGDGRSDVAAANHDSFDISVLLGTGSGTFGPTANFNVFGEITDVVVGDFNGDGRADLAATKRFANTAAVLLGDGAGSFGPPTEFTAIQWPSSLAAADFNQDGNQDLFVLSWGTLAALLLGNGSGGFLPGGTFGTGGGEGAAVAIGDFNKDGKVDVAVANYGSQNVSIRLGDGSGGFLPPAIFPAGPGPHAVAVGDFNGDGKEDLVVGNSIPNGTPPGRVTILLGNGTGGFGPPVSYLTGDMTISVAVGDFNGDGRQDVAAASFGSHEISVLSGDGSGGFLPALNFVVGFAPSSLVAEDFDADGKPDLAVVHSHNLGDVWVLLNTTEFRRSDLAVAIDDGTTVAVPGSPLTYTITVTNLGPDAVTSLRLVDSVPAALLNPVFTAGAGSYNPATGLWTGLNLAAGQSVTLILSGVVDPMATGTLVDTATVATVVGVLDPNAANDSDTDTDAVAAAANLTITMSDSPDPVPVGGALTYALTISNLGPLQATGITVVDPLPAAVSFVSASPECTASAGTVTCLPGSLNPGASQVLTIQVTANPYTMATNTASVTATQVDPLATDNMATEQTLILFGGEGELTHGTVLWKDLAALPGPVAKDGVFRIFREPRSSHEVVVDAASGDISGPAGVLLQRVGGDLVTVLQDSVAVGVGFGRSLRSENVSASAVGDEAIRVRSAGCSTDCGSDDVYRIRAYETTYSIPRFNDTGGQTTVLVIHNHGDEPVTGNIWFWGHSGALLASRSLALGARGTLVLDTTTVAGLAGTAGTITVSNDGRYGVLVGKAVALEPSTGFTFDTPMAPRP